ncbi:hypothetical protein Skr01_58400 [Sphaerisporangium krabiense]|uniref:Thioredoxin domain-containing protein n=1 Tax=Sphaerisporangium krabiense TaxID=763782 RepID=A0A7W9DSR5_9ACTN|nr:TlpA disulfide reductase family protein [Sphaerisporangium krabiense]MBB5629394.1 hypothetical protein [Sphaerisporangium krabiense]GII65755.1 hypothetical protein Skr01_58400 [Sphaerisporangium krabiense]
MPLIIAALLLIGVLSVLNLLLTYGVIRRLRRHATLIEGGAMSGGPPMTMLEPGTTVGDFAVLTTDGVPLTRETLPGRTLVAFFSSSCRPCRDKLPAFVEQAHGYSGGRDATVCVVIGDTAESADMVAALEPVAHVVTGEHGDDEISRAFQVQGYPSYYLTRDKGVVEAGAFDLAALPRGAFGR